MTETNGTPPQTAPASTPEVVQRLTGAKDFTSLSELPLDSEKPAQNGKVSRSTLFKDAVGEPEAPKAKATEATEGSEGQTTPTPAEVAKLKAYLKDAEYELPEEAVFKLKIDSKEVEVPLKDLARNYQGKVPWERHYKELKDAQKKHEDDVKLVDTKFKSLLDTLSTDPKKALSMIVEWSGKNPADYPFLYADELEGKTEDEQKVILREKELAHRAEELKKREAEIAEAKGRKEIEDYIRDRQKEAGITDQELENAYNLVASTAEKDPNLYNGKTPKEVADLMINYVLQVDRPYVRIENILTSINPEYAKDSKGINFIKNLLSPEMEDSDIIDIAKAYYDITDSTDSSEDEDPEEEKKVKAKSSKDSSKESPKKATSPKTHQKKEKAELEEDDDPKTFEDLMRPYR